MLAIGAGGERHNGTLAIRPHTASYRTSIAIFYGMSSCSLPGHNRLKLWKSVIFGLYSASMRGITANGISAYTFVRLKWCGTIRIGNWVLMECLWSVESNELTGKRIFKLNWYILCNFDREISDTVVVFRVYINLVFTYIDRSSRNMS